MREGTPPDDRPVVRPVVLVVDDDFDIREALQDVLEDAGYAVDHAADGAEAWAYLGQKPPPAVILLDLCMPVMNGQELLRRIQSTQPTRSIPTILMTASPHMQADCGVPLLQKPMPSQTLLDLLDKVAPLQANRQANKALSR